METGHPSTGVPPPISVTMSTFADRKMRLKYEQGPLSKDTQTHIRHLYFPSYNMAHGSESNIFFVG